MTATWTGVTCLYAIQAWSHAGPVADPRTTGLVLQHVQCGRCTLRWVHHEFNSSNDDSWYINIIVSQFTNSVSELSFANSNQMLIICFTMFYCMYIMFASLALIVRWVFQSRRPQTFSTLPRFKIKEAFSFEKASQQYHRSALLKAEGKVGNNLPG